MICEKNEDHVLKKWTTSYQHHNQYHQKKKKMREWGATKCSNSKVELDTEHVN